MYAWNTQIFFLFRLDTSKPTDFKEAFNVTEPFNNEIPWPGGQCSNFQPTVSSFFQTCEKLSLGILDLIALGLKLEVGACDFLTTQDKHNLGEKLI